jgi:hypothetical protein
MRKRLQPTKLNIFACYLARVMANLHLILCFSPLGEAFRNRLRMFPSLVNCSTIDWFAEWPREALHSVAHRLLTEENLELGERNIHLESRAVWKSNFTARSTPARRRGGSHIHLERRIHWKRSERPLQRKRNHSHGREMATSRVDCTHRSLATQVVRHVLQGRPCMISASRGAVAPSRHRRDSPPSDEAVRGLIFDFERISHTGFRRET